MKTKPYLLFCLSVLLTSSLFAQVGFDRHGITDYTSRANGVEQICSADIDGDGDLDILSASYNDDKIAWYENTDSSGIFSTPRIISTHADGATAVSYADLDGDGDTDVLSASALNNSIQWYENMDGEGNFSDGQIISDSVIGASSVFAADLDGDGDFDILAAAKETNEIVWYENIDTLSTFGPGQIIANNVEGANDVHAADLDGDGDMDILAAAPEGWDVIWYENIDTTNTFTSGSFIEQGTIGAYAIETGDVDGDGDLDVLLAAESGVIQWYRNTDGAGNFSIYNNIGVSAGANAIHAADIDGDNDLDVLTTGFTDDRVSLFENLDGLGTFGNHQTIRSVEGPKSVITADLDADGDLDVISGTNIPGQILWSENDSLVFENTYPITYQLLYPRSISLGNINGDSLTDIVVVSYGDNIVYWYANLGDGTYSAPQIVYKGDGEEEEIIGLDIADFNGDGAADVLISVHGYGTVAWMKNIDGLGTFGPKQTIADDGDAETLALDIDNDGDLDVIYLPNNNEGIRWIENMDGQGNFSDTSFILSEQGFSNNLRISDIDVDGDKDILYAADSGIFLLENLGEQNGFDTPLELASNIIGLRYMITEDFNGDGHLDIAYATHHQGGNEIAWLENANGQNNFGAPQVFTNAVDFPSSIAAADIDNDGDADLVAAGNYDSTLSWFENVDGQGEFGAKQNIRDNLFGIDKVMVSDVDVDGDVDIITVLGAPSSELLWFENQNINGNEIRGYFWIDAAADGCDSTDTFGASNLMVKAVQDTDTLTTFSLNNGLYQFFPGEGEISIRAEVPSLFSLSPMEQTIVLSGLGNVDTLNFCLEPVVTLNDLQVSLLPTSESRPGFDASYQLVYRNNGTTQLDGTLTMEYDETKLSWLSASEAVSEQTVNTLSFEYTGLNPFETRTIDVEFNVFAPPTVNIDDSLSFVCTINPTVGDQTPEDNVFELDQVVIGSYDPNDISVLEGATITPEQTDDYLHYLIRFQNTGTASAINVRVENELDANLNWSSIQLLSMSHPGRVEIIEGNQVAFIFNNINLPDSTSNEPESHGFIAYKIKPRADIQIGESMSNRADIYFDFNEPILTNTVVTTVEEPIVSNVNELNGFPLRIYPNPVRAELFVETPEAISEIILLDLTGKIKKVVQNEMRINVSDLAPGFYLCKVTTVDGRVGVEKVARR